MMEVKLHDYRINCRRRINRNPALSLAVFNQMKDEAFGFAPTILELNARLLSISIEERNRARI